MQTRRLLSGVIAGLIALTCWGTATAGAVLSGSFNGTSLGPGDDNSSAAVPMGFTINWDGVSYSSLYVNNNGNVTFDSVQAAYTPGALNTLGKPVIAPFFADVDTRTKGSPVSYGTGTYQGHAAFGANWVNVSCYNGTPAANNSYQMILVDRSDTGTGNFDIVLNYDKLAWESGMASNGNIACLNGIPARAGFYGGSAGTNHYYYELPGSGVSGAMLDTGSNPLVAGHSAGEIDGRYVFAIRAGRPEGMWLIKGLQPSAAQGSISCLAAMVLTGDSAQCTVAIQPGNQFAGWGGDCAGAGTSTTCILSNVTRDQTVSAQILVPAALQISSGAANPSVAGVPVPLAATLNSAVATSGASTISFCSNATTTDASCTGGTLLCQATLAAGGSTATCNANLTAGSTQQISAYYPGDQDHFAAASPSITQSVGQFAQNISFTSTAAAGVTVGSTYTVTATGGGSGNAVTFSIDASSNGNCSLSGSNLITFLSTGPCQINANQAGNAEYAAASPRSQTVTPGKAPQTITFTSAPVGPKVGGKYTVTATGGASGNAVSFSIDASSAGICSINASTVTFETKGSCVINADQKGNSNYDDATQARQSVSIGLGNSGVGVASTPNPSVPLQTVTFTVSVALDAAARNVSLPSKAVAIPTGTVEIFDGSTSLGSATLAGGTATITTRSLTTVGSHSITANYSGDTNYPATNSTVYTQSVVALAPVPVLGEWWEKLLLSLMLLGLAAIGVRMRWSR